MGNIRVLADDGSIHEFPDDTDSDVINNTLAGYNAGSAPSSARPVGPHQPPSDLSQSLPPSAGQSNSTGQPNLAALDPLSPQYQTLLTSGPGVQPVATALRRRHLNYAQAQMPMAGPVVEAVGNIEDGDWKNAALNAYRAESDIYGFRPLVDYVAGSELGTRTDGTPDNGPPTHPDFWQSLVPMAGPAEEASADGQEGNYLGAGFNTALALSDADLVSGLGRGLARGLVMDTAGKTWGTYSRLLREAGHFDPGEIVHHWFFPQNALVKGTSRLGKVVNSWVKAVPASIKHNPWNLVSMPSGEVHNWVHGLPWKEIPPFSPDQRLWYGTPTWFKESLFSTTGHGSNAYDAAQDQGSDTPPNGPRQTDDGDDDDDDDHDSSD